VWKRSSHAFPPHYTPAYTNIYVAEQAKAYTHTYVTYASFRELIIAYPNGGQWAPLQQSLPSLAQTSSYATGQAQSFHSCNFVS